VNSFAFIIHPLDPKGDVKRKYWLLGTLLPEPAIHFVSRYFPPVLLSHIKGIRSQATGEEVEGWLLACPMTAKRLLEVPLPVAYAKIVETGRLAERLGARIVGLGAFTSVVGDAGVTVARQLSIPVTTGNSYTVAATAQTLEEAIRRKGVSLQDCVVAVVGATGSIGRALSFLLAGKAAELILISRREEKLRAIAEEISRHTEGRITYDTSIRRIEDADVIITVTSAVRPLIGPQGLKRGAIVCDVALPPNISPEVTRKRKDILLFKGGVVKAPGEPELGFNIGLPSGLVYACMAETMVLALEGRYESYTLGREIEPERVREIAQLAAKHGFQPVMYTASPR